jgi:hypothetical protein
MEETGECGEHDLNHSDGQAEKFYRDLKQRGICVRVGMEATGYSRWFERLLAELGFELWIGDQRRSRPSESRSGIPTARMPDSCSGCCGKITFRKFGYRARRIEICDNCCGTGIGWCRCAHES